MSNFKVHLIAGSVASTTVLAGTLFVTKQPEIAVMFSGSVLVGSLAPDIDAASIPSRIFAWLGIILSAFLLYVGMNQQAAIVGIIYMAFSSDKHRGLTHGWLLIIVCAAVGILGAYNKIPVYFTLLAPFALGLVIHKMMDR